MVGCYFCCEVELLLKPIGQCSGYRTPHTKHLECLIKIKPFKPVIETSLMFTKALPMLRWASSVVILTNLSTGGVIWAKHVKTCDKFFDSDDT